MVSGYTLDGAVEAGQDLVRDECNFGEVVCRIVTMESRTVAAHCE